MNEGESFIRNEAKRRGIDPDIAVQAAMTEGGTMPPGNVGKFNTGWSFWQFQLHYGGAGYEHMGNTAGMGNSFSAKTGWAPGDPAAWKDAARYALDEIKRAGWSKWYGPATIGITGRRGIDPNFHWPGTPTHEWDYIARSTPVPTPLPFNPDARVDLQPDDWSCSVQSAEWLLRSIGRNPGDQWIQDELLGKGIVTREHGLMDASGATLAAWLTTTYGNEMGWVAQASPVVFEDVYAGAGTNPMMIGGRGWNHWAGVRSAANGDLVLANPAPNWKGVGDTMSRAEFAAQGPFTCIWIDRMSTLPTPVPEPPAPPADTRHERAMEHLRKALAVLEEPAPV